MGQDDDGLQPGDQPLTEALRSQFGESFRMLREVVAKLDDEQWGLGGPAWTEVPARAVMHVLLCARFYVHDTPEPYEWEPGGVHYWEDPIESLPGREQALEAIDETRRLTEAYLLKHGDEELLRGQAESAGAGQSRVEWMLYAMRHLQHHAAQLSAECKRRGIGAAAWETV